MAITKYGDITPLSAGFISKEMLRRALPLLILEKFMQAVTLPKHNTLSVLFKRYESLGLALTPLTEGVTPISKKLVTTDISVTLAQYGSLVGLTDVIEDTHEDNVKNQAVTLAGEEAAQTIETLRFNVLKACSNKFYSNGSARTDVTSPLSGTLQKKIVRALKRQDASTITEVGKSSIHFNTEAVKECFIAVTHTDLENDIRDMPKFIDTKDYGHGITPFEGEIGAVGQVRYLISNIFTSYADAGGAAGVNVSTSGAKADVYPIIYMAKHFWAGVALKGKTSIVPMVLNPGIARGGDELGQRGSVGWKTYNASIILNDFFGAVAEVTASDL